MQIADNSFSAIISSSVFEHIPHKDMAFEEGFASIYIFSLSNAA
jgi:hypothetical protein